MKTLMNSLIYKWAYAAINSTINLITKISTAYLLLAFFILCIQVGGQVQAGVAKDKLSVFYNSIKSMSATFTQTTLNSHFKVAAEASGKMAMQRPGKFRWDYSSPYQQIIVADGTKLWVYDKDLEQVTVNKLDSVIGNTPVLLLSGDGSLENNFEIVEIQDKTANLDWVELFPKDKDSSFTSMRLGFGTQNLEYMELVDGFGQTTQIKFTDIRNNPELNSDQFKFTPPDGVDVIGAD